MSGVSEITGRAIVLDRPDIDTDQIIPARFLKVTDKAGLGEKLFHDWRYAEDGSPRPEFVLHQPGAAGSTILVAGDNFGCGSSREHAPWALVAWGFRAVIAPSFADIFRGNALKNQLVPVAIPVPAWQALRDAGGEITVDIPAQTVSWPGGRAEFPLDPFAKKCLVLGTDELGYLLSFREAIDAHEQR
jgi:3-isopropylmalate/(R)-2-methylmalate dehydratase small subunit